MAGNTSDIRRQKEAKLQNALRDDPQKKNASTRKLQADYDSARSDELNQTGQNEQARGFF
ncbi:MAG TPA: hypothetical protein VGO98_02190 [Candidatus Saccharimonadales bacterium]|jgi:hypothetical protein|nr:hypothetical protein [Candidatus Saccharimonadales bacterium]